MNVKESIAATETVKSLAKENEMVHLSVDNSVAFAYLKNWGWNFPFKSYHERFSVLVDEIRK